MNHSFRKICGLVSVTSIPNQKIVVRKNHGNGPASQHMQTGRRLDEPERPEATKR